MASNACPALYRLSLSRDRIAHIESPDLIQKTRIIPGFSSSFPLLWLQSLRHIDIRVLYASASNPLASASNSSLRLLADESR